MSSKEKMKHEQEKVEAEGNASEQTQHKWNTFYGGKFDCFWIQMSK